MQLKSQSKKLKPNSGVQIESYETLGFEPTFFEKFTRKGVDEDRHITQFDYWFPNGCELSVPAWVNDWNIVKAKVLPCRAYIEGAQNPNAAVMIYPRGDRSLKCMLWYYECLINCAMYWRWKQGFTVRDRAGKRVWPRIDDEGYPVVDEWEREDGGKSVVRAIDLPTVVCSYDDVRDFNKALGRGPTYAWTLWKGKSTYSMYGGHLAIYATGEPQMEQIDYAVPASGPQRPTTHGSAKWADGKGASTWLSRRG